MDIQKDLLTEYNPNGKLTISDLELAGMILGCIVLLYIWNDLVFNM